MDNRHAIEEKLKAIEGHVKMIRHWLERGRVIKADEGARSIGLDVFEIIALANEHEGKSEVTP